MIIARDSSHELSVWKLNFNSEITSTLLEITFLKSLYERELTSLSSNFETANPKKPIAIKTFI